MILYFNSFHQGSSPQLKCGISQRGTRSVECNATGYPEPNILFKVIDESDRSEKSVFGKSIRITVRKSYQGLAFNPFGAVSGQVYRSKYFIVVERNPDVF